MKSQVLTTVLFAVVTFNWTHVCNAKQTQVEPAKRHVKLPTESVVGFIHGLPNLNAEIRKLEANDGQTFLKSVKRTNQLEVPFVRLGNSDFDNRVMIFAYGSVAEICHLELRLRCSTNVLLDKYKLRLADRLAEFMHSIQRELPTEAKTAIANIESTRRNRSSTVYQATIDGLTIKVRYHSDGSNPPLISVSLAAAPKNEAVDFWIDHQTLKSKLASLKRLNEQMLSQLETLNSENNKLAKELTNATDTNVQAHFYLKQLRGNSENALAQSKTKIRSKGKTQRPANPAFANKNVTINRGQFGNIELIGELSNNSNTDYKMASFKIVLYDANQKLIGVESFTLSNFGKGTTKAFNVPMLRNLPADTKFRIELDSGF